MPIKSTQRTLRKCMRRLMRQNPMSKISISSICDMAEVSRRTFYRYYPDKYALFTDTYIQEFYNHLKKEPDENIYDFYYQIAEQMYEDQDFFTHAIMVKDQNGFWELMADLLLPVINSDLTSDPTIDEDKRFYISKDIEITLHYFEKWIRNGYDQTPQELIDAIVRCNAIHGKWQYQIAMRRKPDEYTLEKLLNKEW